MSEVLKEKCGIFGVFGEGMEAARLTYSGLYALQHRGQESSGIVSCDRKRIYEHKRMGLVAHVYTEGAVEALKGDIAIGHNRYSTSKSSSEDHIQPVIRHLRNDDFLALVHNGNLPSVRALENFLQDRQIATGSLNDSEMMAEALKYYLLRGACLEDAIEESSPLFTGAFSLLIMTSDKLIALRDHCGIRPLSVAKLNGGFIFSSETCALDVVDADFIRDVRPGEALVADRNGLNGHQIRESKLRIDSFEFVYFARPDSYIEGRNVNTVRKNLGKILAAEDCVDADIVIPIPDSGIPAALGYAQSSCVPFGEGLIKNRYIHRTFIEPAQRLRDMGVKRKLNPLREELAGKRVVVIDDSIVRGTTAPKIVEMIRKAGAREVHLRISSPPVRFPDFYGIDTPRQDQLMAARYTLEQMKEIIGADSLKFLSYSGLIEAIGLPEENVSTSCFTGNYPVNIQERWSEILLAVT